MDALFQSDVLVYYVYLSLMKRKLSGMHLDHWPRLLASFLYYIAHLAIP